MDRGFCGSFNEEVLRFLEQELSTSASEGPSLIAVGTKLVAVLEADPRLAGGIPGASAAEEVPAVLNRLVETLDQLTGEKRAHSLTVVHWDVDTEQVVSVSVLPPFQAVGEPSRPTYPFPPGLNLPPKRFLELLIEHYLFAALNELLYSSLMAEHQQRAHHLEGALRRIDDRVQELILRRNALRQEEITEEIELILLNRPATEQ